MRFERLYWTLYLGFHIAGQSRFPFRPVSVVRRHQSRRIRRMADYAYRHVPFYREVMEREGLKPGDIRTAEDLAKLPIIERAQYQRSAEMFRSTSIKTSRCLRLHTGGTTGIPLAVYHDPAAVVQTAAHMERYRSVLMKVLGRRRYRETLIIPREGSNYVAFRHFLAERTCLYGRLSPGKQFLSIWDPPQVNIQGINAFHPDIVHSYGSYLEFLFSHLDSTGEAFYRPKALGFGADGLAEPARRMIQDRFGLPAFSAYNSVEAQRIAFECEEHAGLHINEDLYVLRIVDDRGRTLPPGEFGEVVVSNLVNRATVLLNYRLGDMAARLPGPCPCGRSLALMSYPEGRSYDWPILPNGQRIHPQLIYSILTTEDDILHFQAIQRPPLSFLVKLVVRKGCPRGGLSFRLGKKFARVFGEPVNVEVQFVPSIPRTSAGKVRPVIVARPGEEF